METIYEKYMALPIDKGLLCLEYGDIAEPYFCYPVNAKPIGFEGCILYCFLPVNIPLRRSRLSGKMETTCPDRRKPL